MSAARGSPRPPAPEAAELPASTKGEFTWEVARFFPRQGDWTEEDYLTLHTNQLVELSNGCLEFLPSPTHAHQTIAAYLYQQLDAFVNSHAPGIVIFAPLPMHLWPGVYREPDLLYMKAENTHRIGKYWERADLLMEVVSSGNPDHDRDTKRKEYAQAGIPEYWIVDPLKRHILVLTLKGRAYRVHGEFGPGTQATSVLLPGFAVPVDQVLALAAPEDL
jgi:Uma2 family endonuclease